MQADESHKSAIESTITKFVQSANNTICILTTGGDPVYQKAVAAAVHPYAVKLGARLGGFAMSGGPDAATPGNSTLLFITMNGRDGHTVKGESPEEVVAALISWFASE